MNKSSFLERLRSLLTVLHVTDSAFARAGGVSKSTFSNYINGNSQPKQEALSRWVQKFGLNANWLLTGEGEMFLGEETEEQPDRASDVATVTDPIAQRLETATRILKEAGASSEMIQQAVMKILDSQNEPHSEVEETLRTPAFANDRDRSIKRS